MKEINRDPSKDKPAIWLKRAMGSEPAWVIPATVAFLDKKGSSYDVDLYEAINKGFVSIDDEKIQKLLKTSYMDISEQFTKFINEFNG
jgi:hypothetical protein